MTVSIERTENVLIVSWVGQVNSANAAQVQSAFLEAIDNGEKRCVLDLTQLAYISSAGLRVILLAAKRLKQCGGALVLLGLQPNVREVFEISGFLSILKVVDERAAAMAMVGAQP